MKWEIGDKWMPWHLAFGLWPDWYRECIKPGGIESSERHTGAAIEQFLVAILSTPAIPLVPFFLPPAAILRWFIRLLRRRAKRKQEADVPR